MEREDSSEVHGKCDAEVDVRIQILIAESHDGNDMFFPIEKEAYQPNEWGIPYFLKDNKLWIRRTNEEDQHYEGWVMDERNMFDLGCTWKLNVEIFILEEEKSGSVVDAFIKEA